MTRKHHLTHADQLYAGGGVYAPMYAINERVGVPFELMTMVDFGAPLAIDTNALVAAATSTELPNNATKTYTTADSGSSPLDDAGLPTVATLTDSTGTARSVWVLDVPRNITLTATHGSSLVAMTLLVTGFDVYGQLMTELFTITATGTSKTATGKKAFKYILSYAFASAGDATANTANVGFADVLGFPYCVADKADVIACHGNGTMELASSTVVAADATAATNATGDVRGTIDFNTASDGTKKFRAYFRVADRSSEHGLRGVDQA